MSNPSGLGFTRYGTGNMILPPEGPSVVPVNVDFTSAANLAGFVVDLNNIIQSGVMTEIQGVFVDNADNPNKLYLTSALINQRLVIPANSQVYAPLFVSTSPQFTFSSSAGAPNFVSVIFYNVPIYPLVIK